MKKILIFMAAFIVTFIALTLTACGGNPDGLDVDKDYSQLNEEESANVENDASLQIVATIFPEYDWVREILGDKVNDTGLTLLLDSGVDLHSYQPTAEDIVKISNCDIFIYVGGESDEWVEDVLKSADNKDMIVINLLESLGGQVKEEELKEGMQGEEEEESGEEADDEDDEASEEEPELDEHVWLSLRNARLLCDEIEKAIEEKDPGNADIYRTNVDLYKEKLAALDEKYKETVDNAAAKTLLFGDRFPFRYMTEDYGLDYYAAFVGCLAETEASFETITFLAGKVDELGLKSVFTIEGSDGKIAETIINSTETKDQKILVLNSMQSVTAKNVEEGADYLSIMESNLEVLKEGIR